ncbi:MAG: 30S ribosomal protein S12 methylthiotransferase RimO [Eggerthellaceae bacterium]|nr:30S ribosomal protein S12 methylthiotransferase RimO [Eggerthellaceae bacterium]
MGCAKNEVDSQHMAARLVAAGYDVVEDPETADVVIVNTCTFIQAATEESIDAVLDVAGFESVAEGRAHLVVAGCMPARYGHDLAAELTEASRFVPCSEEPEIVSIVDGLLGEQREDADVLNIPGYQLKRTGLSAYVKISDGCDRFCAYCTIPYIRGRYRSFPENEIMAEVAGLVESGTREVVLIAQDTGRWGQDFDEPSTLAALMGDLAESFSEVWFRVMYIQPEGVTDELIETVASHDNICSYFDIPFQHSSAAVLSSMNRKGNGDEFLELMAKIRNRIPDATLRTTLIAGYPGENDEQFEELCEFVEEAELDYIGVFAYSREEGTRAYSLDGQLEEDEKLERAQRLRDLADDVCTARIAGRVGSQMDVLVCGVEEDGQLFGRAKCQAPDVDGVTYVQGCSIGDVCSVIVDDVLLYEMEGTVVR